MKEYKKIIDFKYKNNMYTMFIDNKDKYYFLKKDLDNNYSYVDINTFLELGKIFSKTPHILKAKKNNKIKLLPKVLVGSSIVALTLAGISDLQKNKEVANEEFNNYVSQIKAQESIDNEEESEAYVDNNIVENSKLTYYDKDDNENENAIEVDTYYYFPYLKRLVIYDNDYLGEYFKYDNASLDDLYNSIDSNNNLSSYFKGLLKEFCKDYVNRQPNAERRILNENLKDLKIVECETSTELYIQTLSDAAVACYVKDENAIYTMKGYKYEKGTWDYQVLYHELSHAARSYMTTDGEKEIVCRIDGMDFYTVTSIEALNSLFSVSLFDYDEKDIAYQLQSNMFKILIDNMDNYEITDYMNHSLTYFVSKLDEAHGDKNYAKEFLELVEAQYNDYYADYINVEQSEYYPIYEYVSDFYYKNRINENTSYEDAYRFCDELLESMMFDVPESYNIDKDYFYEYLDAYCEKIGIQKSVHSK